MNGCRYDKGPGRGFFRAPVYQLSLLSEERRVIPVRSPCEFLLC